MVVVKMYNSSTCQTAQSEHYINVRTNSSRNADFDYMYLDEVCRASLTRLCGFFKYSNDVWSGIYKIVFKKHKK